MEIQPEKFSTTVYFIDCYQRDYKWDKGSNVKQFEELLRAEFESKWEFLRKRRGVSQESLFPPGPTGGLNLS